jgi:hypothetical protein
VCETTRFKGGFGEEGKVVDIEGLRKKKKKMNTCLRIQFEDSMNEENEGKEIVEFVSYLRQSFLCEYCFERKKIWPCFWFIYIFNQNFPFLI